MSNLFIALKAAMIWFPVLSALFTIPYILVQYKKYGSIPMIRTIVVYSFILYLMVVYFLVILPLPAIGSVKPVHTMQLVPFQFVQDFMRETSLVITDPGTYVKALTERGVTQVVFNVLMFVPFGVYLRYYFRCSLKKTITISFLFTLFLELTQLTGLYGIYPGSYRVFDVDDLMLNTCGGWIGYGLAPLFAAFVPSREQVDQMAYQNSGRVTIFRRLTAFVIDCTLFLFIAVAGQLVSLGSLGALIGKPLYFLALAAVYFVALPWAMGSQTPGKRAVHIEVVGEDGEPAGAIQYGIHYGLLLVTGLLGILAVPLFIIETVLIKTGVMEAYCHCRFSHTRLVNQGHEAEQEKKRRPLFPEAGRRAV